MSQPTRYYKHIVRKMLDVVIPGKRSEGHPNQSKSRASDFPLQKKKFRFKKSEIPFRFRFIIGKVEFDEITINISKENHEIVIGFPMNLNYHWIKITISTVN